MIQIATYLENTVRLFESEDLCYAHGTENARDEAIYLVLCSLGIPFDADALYLQEPLSPVQLELLDERVRRRVEERIAESEQSPVRPGFLVERVSGTSERVAAHCLATRQPSHGDIVPRAAISEVIVRSGVGPISGRHGSPCWTQPVVFSSCPKRARSAR